MSSSDHVELILNLFEFFWFEHSIFSKASQSPPVLDKGIEEVEPEAKSLPRGPSMIFRSFSDQGLSSKDESNSDSSTPKSVLATPTLQTILSGKEVGEFEEVAANKGCLDVAYEHEGRDNKRMRRKKRKGSSRSLSELEFEELKGFMDLGFVFSDEDKDSSLVSIIPGLQRLGRKEVQSSTNGDSEKKGFQESSVPRPYLSEAWDDVLEKNKKTQVNPILMNWRIPAFGNEMELKDHLKFWAHTVASAVR